jgi:hypothetical protein
VCSVVFDELDARLLLLPELEVAVDTASDHKVSGSCLRKSRDSRTCHDVAASLHTMGITQSGAVVLAADEVC